VGPAEPSKDSEDVVAIEQAIGFLP